MSALSQIIQENLHFLVSEVDTQLQQLAHFFRAPAMGPLATLESRRGYVSNLRMRVQRGTVRSLSRSRKPVQQEVRMRAVDNLAQALEHLTDTARGCMREFARHADKELPTPPKRKQFRRLVKRIISALELIEPGLFEADTHAAVRLKQRSDRMLKTCETLQRELLIKSSTEEPARLLSSLFACFSLRQMVLALEQMAEAILSANLGQSVNLSNLSHIRQAAAELQKPLKKLDISTLAETRSGSAIAGIRKNGSSRYLAIYKEGDPGKVVEEVQGVESWHEIYPGLAPRILAHSEKDGSASMLIEHLPGQTLESLLFADDEQLLEQASRQLMRTLRSIWRETRNKTPEPAQFMRQLDKRLPAILSVHPEFDRPARQICGETLPSLQSLVDQTAEVEARCPPPFSVYIHGDFNVDNIIYDPTEKRIFFIDLHRSRYLDYCQDISVLMVSIYRLQILEPERRRRLMAVARALFTACRRFARQQQDDTFDLRLAIGLARSFITSTRFIFDKSLAGRMYLRALYLMEQISATRPGKETRFKLPLKELFLE